MLSILSGHASSGSTPGNSVSLGVSAVFIAVGILVAFNFRDAAYSIHSFFNGLPFGSNSTSTPNKVRFVGGIFATMGACGILVTFLGRR